MQQGAHAPLQGLDLSQLLLTDSLGWEERNSLLIGRKPILERSLYSNGDAKWARLCADRAPCVAC